VSTVTKDFSFEHIFYLQGTSRRRQYVQNRSLSQVAWKESDDIQTTVNATSPHVDGLQQLINGIVIIRAASITY